MIIDAKAITEILLNKRDEFIDPANYRLKFISETYGVYINLKVDEVSFAYEPDSTDLVIKCTMDPSRLKFSPLSDYYTCIVLYNTGNSRSTVWIPIARYIIPSDELSRTINDTLIIKIGIDCDGLNDNTSIDNNINSENEKTDNSERTHKISQCKIYDIENDRIHSGILLEDGNVICGCCGGLLEKDDFGQDKKYMLLKTYTTWVDLDNNILD